MLSLISGVFFFATWAWATPSPDPVVSIDAGTLQGGRCTSISDAIFFKGIPYAEPPTGNLRFAVPNAYGGQYPNGFRLANSSASDCIQFGTEFAINDTLTSEDCLYLNIWAPSHATNASALPVQVWIYGGGEDAGGISYYLYDGSNVAQNDALLVTVNYRLGPLGFLALESAGIQGNQGIQDLLLALEWVKTNIAAFGGDPEKVLLFGQSAGATNTFIISTLPQAPSLIKAAITESGGGRDAELNSTIQSLGAAYAQNLSCTDVSCLRSKSVSELKTVFNDLPALNSGLGIDGAVSIANARTSQFAPYVDGKVIPTQPSDEGVQVPTIFGSASREGALFALGQFYSTRPGGVAGITPDDYTTFLQDNFGSAAPVVEKSYPMSNFNSTGYPGFFAISTVLAESTYLCSAYRGLNRAVEKGIPVWTYLFSHQPSCMWLEGIQSSAIQLLGATHTVEIPYIFGNLGNLPAPDGSCNSSAQDVAISSVLMSAWTAMAAKGDPSTDELNWPAYSNSSSPLGINVLNSTLAGVVDYSHCVLWDRINEGLLNSSITNTTNSTGVANATYTNSASATPTSGAPITANYALFWSLVGAAFAVFSSIL